MDGHFVPNLTIGPEVIKKLRPLTKKVFDVHLMISPVDNFIKDFSKAGADIITFHPEATSDVSKTIKLIKNQNKKVGISLKPKSKIELIESNEKDSPISKFLRNNNSAIHHIAIKVSDIYFEIQRIKNEGIRVLNEIPKEGADNQLICFLHPKDTLGVLIELCQEK